MRPLYEKQIDEKRNASTCGNDHFGVHIQHIGVHANRTADGHSKFVQHIRVEGGNDYNSIFMDSYAAVPPAHTSGVED